MQKQWLGQWSPDGRHLAAAAPQHRVLVRDAELLKLTHVFVCMDRVERLEWSPDSQLLLVEVARQGLVQLFSLADAEWQGRIEEGLAGVSRARWSPSSQDVLVVSDFQLYVAIWPLREMDGAQHPIRLRSPKYSQRGLAFSRNGRWLALLHRSGGQDSVAIYSCEEAYATISDFHVEADAADLAWTAEDRGLLLWDRPARAAHVCWFSPRGELLARVSASWLLRSASLSPAAMFLAIAGFDGRLHVASVTGMKVVASLTHDLKVAVAEAGEASVAVLREELASDGDGAGPGVSARYVRLPSTASVRIPEERLVPELPVDAEGVPRQGISSALWSPDERFLATRHDGMPTTVWVWDLGRLALAALLLHRSPVRSCTWDHSGAARGARCRLAISTADAFVFIWSSEARCRSLEEAVVAGCPLAGARLQWRSDGRALLLQDRDRACACLPGPPPVPSR